MSDNAGWCLIESDPGVFTGLIRELGVSGAQVEELWSLDTTMFNSIKPVHGLIFLFRWMGQEQVEEPIVNDSRIEKIFFAQQVINNACATQAILSVLFNTCHPDIDLGSTLTEFKEFSQKFDANMKGLALSNSQKIRAVHNSFGSNSIFEFDDGGKSKSRSDEAFHFVAIVPIDGHLYELDGLKEGPIDLGVISPNTDWVDSAKPFIEKRILQYKEGEVHFNLMAVVSDRKQILQKQLLDLLANENLSEEIKSSEEEKLRAKIVNEEDKMRRYRIENARRKHNYLPLIVEILKLLAKDGKLVPLYERAKAKSLEKEKQKLMN
ncbi:Hypothetical protein CINCED_3A018516 [Cinara cedri]|uniref:Ubiquitin carboxyl-terminal hydrolase n=1 Tax=Cinara cedri TaxID=506608 RepID=A0A5E4MVI9_9HEMI|nr:Hypothetical protein CINCED_3A018516 [Cinara cedri]